MRSTKVLKYFAVATLLSSISTLAIASSEYYKFLSAVILLNTGIRIGQWLLLAPLAAWIFRAVSCYTINENHQVSYGKTALFFIWTGVLAVIGASLISIPFTLWLGGLLLPFYCAIALVILLVLFHHYSERALAEKSSLADMAITLGVTALLITGSLFVTFKIWNAL